MFMEKIGKTPEGGFNFEGFNKHEYNDYLLKAAEMLDRQAEKLDDPLEREKLQELSMKVIRLQTVI